ncbi:hypothetical protein PCASD_25862, partial [Puccinia coronata f. sp. avenae]
MPFHKSQLFVILLVSTSAMSCTLGHHGKRSVTVGTEKIESQGLLLRRDEVSVPNPKPDSPVDTTPKSPGETTPSEPTGNDSKTDKSKQPKDNKPTTLHKNEAKLKKLLAGGSGTKKEKAPPSDSAPVTPPPSDDSTKP